MLSHIQSGGLFASGMANPIPLGATPGVSLHSPLGATLHAISPRFTRPVTPWRAVVIHGGVIALWLVLFARAFGSGGLLAWSVGLAYIGYDTFLLFFVFVQTLPLRHLAVVAARTDQPAPADVTTLAVIIAARNEAASLPGTLDALFAQTHPPTTIHIADDGSTDGTAALLTGAYALTLPAPDGTWRSATYPTLRWHPLPPGGKARALNAAIARIDDALIATVDADTLLEPTALDAMRAAFTADPALVAATGVLFPRCAAGPTARLFQSFQTYEYMRNFLSRYAWGRQDALLLLSGAFATYRRQPLVDVGGFDDDCLVEDYELTHRLRDYAVRQGLVWHTGVVGAARAATEAPGALGPFLRQRRRWFGGFLQTQVWYRHMVGNPDYGHLGTRMLPVKALDTMQPLYGLVSIGLLLAAILRGDGKVALPVAGVIGAKIALDLAFYLWSLHLYRRWQGEAARVRLLPAILAALIEPFTFQVLRHLGATLGWVSFLTGRRSWGAAARPAASPIMVPAIAERATAP